MKHVNKFSEFITEEHRLGYLDKEDKEQVLEFEPKEGESFEEAKNRLLGDFKFFWSHYIRPEVEETKN